MVETSENNEKEKKYKATLPILAESIIYAESIPEIEEGIKALLKYEKIQYKNLISCKIIKSKKVTTSSLYTLHS